MCTRNGKTGAFAFGELPELAFGVLPHLRLRPVVASVWYPTSLFGTKHVTVYTYIQPTCVVYIRSRLWRVAPPSPSVRCCFRLVYCMSIRSMCVFPNALQYATIHPATPQCTPQQKRAFPKINRNSNYRRHLANPVCIGSPSATLVGT